MFKWEITLGDALTLGFAILAALGSLVPAIRRLYIARCPFRARYADQAFSYVGQGRTYSKTKVVEMGGASFCTASLTVQLTPRRLVTFSEVNIRCVSRDWWTLGLRRQNAPPESIVVSGAWCPDPSWMLRHREGEPLDTGVTGQYSSDQRWPAGKPLWFEISLQATQAWEGELSIANERGDQRRYYTRLPLRVIR